MRTCYYNSFFHYCNIDFLRRNHIDFYDPYFGDCEGMTEAMCWAKKMVMLDQPIYALTINTSQTNGAVIWHENIMQWKSICDAVLQYGAYDTDKLGFIARRILDNYVSLINGLCEGLEVRNEEMNAISKTSLERFAFIEEILQTAEFTEMFYYGGREHYMKKMFGGIKTLYARCIRDGYAEEEILSQVMWLPHLVKALCSWDGEQFVEKEALEPNDLRELYLAISHEQNTAAWGYELCPTVHLGADPDAQSILEEMNAGYIGYFVKRIYELLNLAIQIRQRGRMQEVIRIAQECKDLLTQIQSHLSESETKQIADDIIMVLGAAA
jgi:hypothetical protein